jgi:CheY-like chemotaxis protein
MDIEMPGLNGFETTAEIIKLYRPFAERKPTILACSAYIGE